MAFRRDMENQNESEAFLILSKLLELTYFIKTRRPNRVQTKINLIYSLHQMRFSKFPRDGAGSARCQLDFLISTFDSSVRCGAGGAWGDQTDPISRNVTAISLSPSLSPLRTGSRPGVVSQIG